MLILILKFTACFVVLLAPLLRGRPNLPEPSRHNKLTPDRSVSDYSVDEQGFLVKKHQVAGHDH